ncbi:MULTISPECIES: hypothetical protein [Pseudonocardia]|uniref:Uncharacterized protein n=2 Tax=Pseudonocardia TaxID=1847 RepID=A0A1Y2MHJ1_PSEAH|nr:MULTISPECIES: hypothetical protein [Pseudonocardia]OSY34753.1 hypothetical protein BG845_06586 [Pseudonocardia autotrophica]TDN65415.1 hypothetical protein C8E95_6902 [Pseudonocardia autotrophica]BBG05840.1 hypothetical protein Pdca_70490 [Pseudonocardia autotrophica]GEC29198.1 hypothetical protein PSA01_62270 [Pseudonocardia saturnea]
MGLGDPGHGSVRCGGARWAIGGVPVAGCSGGTAALDWLIAGGSGPLTGHGCARPVTVLAVITELAHADGLTRAARPRRRHYAVGGEHARPALGRLRHPRPALPVPTPAPAGGPF